MTCTTKWIHCGCPRLVTEAKYAASLMCTKVTESLAEDIVIPWESFRVELPRGLFDHDGYSYDHILVCNFTGSEFFGAMMLLEGNRKGNEGEEEDIAVCQIMAADDMAALLLDREKADEYLPDGISVDDEFRKGKARALRLAIRLVVGLLYTMQYTSNFRTHPPSLNDQRRTIRSGPPKHRTIFVGKPIAFDARPAVRSFLDARKGGVPSVQTLVRGHFKRQVVGVTRAGRKVIWIEPYWRGPEDAPILARPFHVGPKMTS